MCICMANIMIHNDITTLWHAWLNYIKLGNNGVERDHETTSGHHYFDTLQPENQHLWPRACVCWVCIVVLKSFDTFQGQYIVCSMVANITQTVNHGYDFEQRTAVLLSPVWRFPGRLEWIPQQLVLSKSPASQRFETPHIGHSAHL